MRLNLRKFGFRGVTYHDKKLATGEVRRYWAVRGVGPLNPLPGDEHDAFGPGTLAFARAYHAMVDAPRKARTVGTLQSIIDGYQRSAAWAKLAPRTRADYTRAIGAIEKKWGAAPLDVIDDPKVRGGFLKWRDDLALGSPRQADATLGVLRIILEFGRDRGILAHNHATRPKKVYKADRSDKLWLPPDMAAIRAVASNDVLLALELALGTGQRKTDLLRLPWAAYVDDPDPARPGRKRIRFRQGKKKRLVDMPVTRELQTRLDATPKRALTILTNKGKPWTVSAEGKCPHFDHSWRAAVLAAGVDGLHFHDVRGTACTKLAEAGATPSEIAAMLGWTVSTVNRMLDTYQAMTAALSDSAVAKLERKA